LVVLVLATAVIDILVARFNVLVSLKAHEITVVNTEQIKARDQFGAGPPAESRNCIPNNLVFVKLHKLSDIKTQNEDSANTPQHNKCHNE